LGESFAIAGLRGREGARDARVVLVRESGGERGGIGSGCGGSNQEQWEKEESDAEERG
jgi:hypothetical protein